MYIRLHVYSMEIQWRHSAMKHRQHNALDKKLNVIQNVRTYALIIVRLAAASIAMDKDFATI